MQYHNTKMNQINPILPLLMQGQPGSQSGESVRPADGMFANAMPGYQSQNALMASGYPGSPSGPTRESDSAAWERALQNILGYGMGAGGGALGLIATDGNPLAAAAGAAPGLGVAANAQSSNVQDVWAHQFMQYLRGMSRGIDGY